MIFGNNNKIKKQPSLHRDWLFFLYKIEKKTISCSKLLI
ncbi:hypothetical protein CUZ88_1440 [Enterococcus xinjiangensis]|nr:hypothetical protein [Enterococcus lactis]